MDDVLVRNAADPDQVSRATEKEKLGRDLELDDLCKVLATESGRRFLWRMLKRARVFETVWEQSARIHYNSGQQDFGHFIMSEIIDANEESYFLMMREAQHSRRKENPNGRRN